MDSKRIEEIATTVIKTELLKCPFLESFIGTNDRTPSWDGEVFVYSKENHTKDDWTGRVPIQVKGTERSFPDTASFSLSVSDLKNYYKDGGCMLFLVGGISTMSTGTIYYSDLQVFDLYKILKTVNHNKTRTIFFERFPVENIAEISTIFANSAENRKMQTSFVGKELISLDQLFNDGRSSESFMLSTSCVGSSPDEAGRFISSHPSYVYAKAEGLDIDIPVDKANNLIVTRVIDGKVAVKGREYYPNYRIEYRNGVPTIRFGKSFSITIDEKKWSMTFHFDPAGTLREQIMDGSFYIAMIEAQEIELNNARSPIKKEVDIEPYKKALHDFQDVQKALDYLGVTEDLDLAALSEKDKHNLKALVNSVVYKKRIRLPYADGQVVGGPFDVGNLSIWIWAIKQDTGEYIIDNFFDNHKIVIFDEKDNKQNNPIPVSQYLLLDTNAFLRASNMNYESVEKGITEMNHHPSILDRTNCLVLSILNAYDQKKPKDDRLLDLADSICKWISEDPNVVFPICRLNQLQIKKRKQPLTSKDVIELSRFADEGNEPMIRCGAFLLLDDSAEAQKCFEQLTPTDQEAFLTYPICFFGRLTISKNNV